MGQILGALFAILVGIVSIPTYLQYQTKSNENLRIAATAQQATKFNTASSSYIQQNSVAIQATATPTTPAVITVAMLKATGDLPASFSDTNPYGQTWVLQVLEPSAGNLQALAMTTGGTALRDAVVTKIAAVIGDTGGFLPQNDSGLYPTASANAYGAFGGTPVSTANYTSISGGEIASIINFNNGQLTDNRLYRNLVPGQPQLNQMNTPLIMASTQTLNAACTTTGAIAQDGNGAVLSCQAGTWQQQGSAYWKDPVASAATLPVCNAAAAWQTRIVKTPTVGTGPRAYTCNGASWSALAVNDSGNMTVPATMTVGKTQVNDVVVEGSACASNGLVARDAVGLLLSCQSGIYRRAQGDTAILAATGQTKLSSGVHIKWGYIGANGFYNFVQPFPTYCASVTFGSGGPGAWANGVPRGSCNVNGVSYSSANSANTQTMYMAIGW